MLSLPKNIEATYLKKQIHQAKLASRQQATNRAIHYYRQATGEAQWLLDYHIDRGDMEISRAIHQSIKHISKELEALETHSAKELARDARIETCSAMRASHMLPQNSIAIASEILKAKYLYRHCTGLLYRISHWLRPKKLKYHSNLTSHSQ